ncbi:MULTISPECIES: hypothetical protein [Lactobacillaceae]|uniref:hypothetical protein n=1 Tax=Lactobacillaceae TaxID=33958 RepID=UPI00128E696E|nr:MULTISPECIES: hypothetical protein [Lactobacillaceae]MQB77744.1 hypothetical protein [Limosilactobacillus reuteri]MQB99805.1 hypothetical protein [Limosilactobacillus reuteri]
MKVYKWILKYKATIIPIIAALFNFIPFHIVSESFTLLLWTLIWTILFGILEQYPFLEVSLTENGTNTKADFLINLSKTTQKHELSIKIKPHKILKKEYNKVLEIKFPNGVSLSSSSKKEQQYIDGNKVKVPIKELANEGRHKLVFVLGLEGEKFSGEDDGAIEFKCEHTIIKIDLINKAKIYWE